MSLSRVEPKGICLSKGDNSLVGLRQLLMYHPENLDEKHSETLSDFLGERKGQPLRTARARCLKDYFGSSGFKGGRYLEFETKTIQGRKAMTL